MNGPRTPTPRLFVESTLAAPKIELDAEQAHYLTHVLRLRRGESVVLFNGRGEEVLAQLAAATKRGATLTSQAQLTPLPEPRLEIVLLQALVKAEAMDLIVQKATELGVAALQPVISAHSVVRLDEERARRRLTHWRRVSRSACEQCGRHRPLEIEAPVDLAAACASLPADTVKLLLDPDARGCWPALAPAPAAVALLCGPEGGFSAEDQRLIEARGFAHLRLGPRTLRAETAALTACALVQARWGDLG